MFQNDLQSKNPKKMEIIGKDWHFVQPKVINLYSQKLKKLDLSQGIRFKVLSPILLAN